MNDNVTSPQGWSVDASNAEALRRAIDLAFDYRGDVTITRVSSPQPIEGYVFDRRDDAGGGMIVRVIPRDGGQRVTIPLADITRIEFTGKDAASGKSFETWVKKYVQKKVAGESANIEAESLD